MLFKLRCQVAAIFLCIKAYFIICTRNLFIKRINFITGVGNLLENGPGPSSHFFKRAKYNKKANTISLVIIFKPAAISFCKNYNTYKPHFYKVVCRWHTYIEKNYFNDNNRNNDDNFDFDSITL